MGQGRAEDQRRFTPTRCGLEDSTADYITVWDTAALILVGKGHLKTAGTTLPRSCGSPLLVAMWRVSKLR